MRIGPKVTVEKSCYGCECEKVEHYAVQGDSGCHVSCTHPLVGSRRIGNDNWTTPDWCPVKVGAGDTATDEIKRLRSDLAIVRDSAKDVISWCDGAGSGDSLYCITRLRHAIATTETPNAK